MYVRRFRFVPLWSFSFRVRLNTYLPTYHVMLQCHHVPHLATPTPPKKRNHSALSICKYKGSGILKCYSLFPSLGIMMFINTLRWSDNDMMSFVPGNGWWSTSFWRDLTFKSGHWPRWNCTIQCRLDEDSQVNITTSCLLFPLNSTV